MLPGYNGLSVSLNRLTDDIVNAALDRCDCQGVSTNTARKAAYMWMSHSAVWDEELEQFQKEWHTDSTNRALDTIQSLSNEIETLLLDEEIRAYRESFIKSDSLSSALRRCNVNADPELMSFVVAAYMVGGGPGLQDECDYEMGSAKITLEDVARVASMID